MRTRVGGEYCATLSHLAVFLLLGAPDGGSSGGGGIASPAASESKEVCESSAPCSEPVGVDDPVFVSSTNLKLRIFSAKCCDLSHSLFLRTTLWYSLEMASTAPMSSTERHR